MNVEFHHCRHCGAQGPIRHEGATYTCPNCTDRVVEGGWIDVDGDGVAIVTTDGVGERVTLAPISPNVFDDLPRASMTVTFEDTPNG